jgi:hypothetical protein
MISVIGLERISAQPGFGTARVVAGVVVCASVSIKNKGIDKSAP